MLTWPHDGGHWARWLEAAEACFTDLAAAIAGFEDVLVVCRDGAHRDEIRERLHRAGVDPSRMHLWCVPSDDTWARDHGPITVLRDGVPVLLDFRFNGWGGKYPAARDDAITYALHRGGAFGEVALERVELVLEGGSIESDGAGTLLTTRTCLLNHNRNALPRDEIERRLTEALGVERFLWLEHGHLEGDDTDSHIDTLARLCPQDTIVHQSCGDTRDPHHRPLTEMARELAAFRTRSGGTYRTVPLPMPAPMHGADGARLPAGYANFLVINGAVLVPVYGDALDAEACRRIGLCFPGRQVVPVNCRVLVEQYGSLHCVTMQIPAQVPVHSPDDTT